MRSLYHPNNFKLIKKNQGLTLVELIVSIGIFSILMGGIMIFIIQNYHSFFWIRESESNQSVARRVLKTMIKEIREMRQGDNGAYALSQAEPQRLSFYANIDSDEEVEFVSYYLNNNNLMKITGQPGDPPTYPDDAAHRTEEIMTGGVRNDTEPLFYYYDANYSGTQDSLPAPIDTNEVKFIKTKLLIDDDPNKAPEALTIESGVQLRNLKDNL